MIKWDASLQLGVETLDRQHRLMVDLANRVHGAHRRDDLPALARHVRELIDATAEHFVCEERMMVEAGYAFAESHSEHHGEVLAQFERFSAGLLERREAACANRALAFLSTWIRTHITVFDRELVAHLGDFRAP
jgi:hemerythrin-like metal-binding protein